MQIHELPSASPSASDYIPIDNGTATRKTTLSSIDMGSNEITFTSGDTSSPSSWQTVAVMASNTAANLMNAISKMVANIRWLYNRLGTSSTGTTATTVTGAIAEHSTKIGSAEMGTTATTLTGAIAEVNDSVSDNSDAIAELNSNLTVKTGTTSSPISGATNSSNLRYYGNVGVLTILLLIPSGSYTNSSVLLNVTPRPTVPTRACVSVYGELTDVILNTDGTLKFNSQSVSITSNRYMLGQIAFITS